MDVIVLPFSPFHSQNSLFCLCVGGMTSVRDQTERTKPTKKSRVVYMIDLKPRCFVPFVLPSRLLDHNHRHPGLTPMDSPTSHPCFRRLFIRVFFCTLELCSFWMVYTRIVLSLFSCFRAASDRQQQQATQQAKQGAGPRAQGWVVVVCCCIGWRKDRGIIIKIKMQKA